MKQAQPNAAVWTNRPSRKLVLFFTALALALGLVATVRQVTVVAATPQDRWFEQDGRLIDPSIIVEPGTRMRAEALSHLINDAILIRGRLPACAGMFGATDLPPDATDAHCLAVIEDALRASPANGELWLFRTNALMHAGQYNEETLKSLRNTYRAAPREGWIASGRVVIGLSLWPFLPQDLQDSVRADLDLVLENKLTGPLAEAYAANATLRSTAAEALETLPKEKMDLFISAVRRSIPASEATPENAS